VKAVVYSRYGAPEVLELKEIPKPSPRDNEVLIKVRATTVTAADHRARACDTPKGFGLFAPLVFGVGGPRNPILGGELAGEVESVGAAVRQFKVGDEVFAFSGAGFGCYVEYKCLPEDGTLALKPSNLSHEQAAALSFGGTTALGLLKKANIRKGDKVLVNGASGGVGTAAVQLAKYFEAEVTGVCSTGNLQMVKAIGADHVIDYTSNDFTRNRERYDIIVDTVGTAPFSRVKDSLKEDGRLVIVLGTLADLLQAPWVSMLGTRKVIATVVNWNAGDLRFLARLAESGQFTPVIDRRYPLEQITAAHRHVDSGRKKGNVVITV